MVAYVFFQLIWWGIHIIQLTGQLGEGDDYTSRRIWMIIGEGIVFFILLSFGVIKIRKAFKEEVKLAQQKQNFALSVSHELKSPVAAIKLFLQTLEKRDLTEDQKKDIINKCIASTDRLDGLVNNILLSNIVDTKNYQLAFENVNLKMQLEELISIYQHTNSSAEITLEYTGNESVEIDKSSFISIASNLIDNAVKYSGKSAQVSLSAQISTQYIILEVADNGPGISNKEKELIFTKFYRSGNEMNRSAKGTGLGLFIVRELVSLHKGTVSIQKNQPTGSIFIVKIPLEK